MHSEQSPLSMQMPAISRSKTSPATILHQMLKVEEKYTLLPYLHPPFLSSVPLLSQAQPTTAWNPGTGLVQSWEEDVRGCILEVCHDRSLKPFWMAGEACRRGCKCPTPSGLPVLLSGTLKSPLFVVAVWLPRCCHCPLPLQYLLASQNLQVETLSCFTQAPILASAGGPSAFHRLLYT